MEREGKERELDKKRGGEGKSVGREEESAETERGRERGEGEGGEIRAKWGR